MINLLSDSSFVLLTTFKALMGFTSRRATELGLDQLEYLKQNDSFHFSKKLDDVLITRPTGTNVMDMAVLIVL